MYLPIKTIKNGNNGMKVKYKSIPIGIVSTDCK